MLQLLSSKAKRALDCSDKLISYDGLGCNDVVQKGMCTGEGWEALHCKVMAVRAAFCGPAQEANEKGVAAAPACSKPVCRRGLEAWASAARSSARNHGSQRRRIGSARRSAIRGE
jgi:hypothetical protein